MKVKESLGKAACQASHSTKGKTYLVKLILTRRKRDLPRVAYVPECMCVCVWACVHVCVGVGRGMLL